MSRAARSLQRLERILTVVPWLLDNPGVSVQETAQRFGVPPGELVADLDLLGYCGLPGYGGGDLVETSIFGDAIVVGMADFFRRPLALSVREGVTLLLAARALTDVPGMAEAPALSSAAAKLEAALGATLDSAGMALDLRAPGDEHVPALRAAVAERRVVHLSYRSASAAELTERDVEPWAVTGAHGAWYLQGYCRLARAPRDFRLDRIRTLTPTAEVLPGDATPPTPPRPTYRPAPGDHRVVLDLDRDAWWLAEWAVTDAVEPHGPRRRATLRTPTLEWVARLVLRVAPGARVVAPGELRARVAELATQTLRSYRPIG